MATKKQRRRQEKLRRHEWEEVYIDEEGREVPVEEIETTEPAARSPKKEASKSSAPVRAGRGRVIEPPSWQRVLRRAAIFAPIMFVIVYLLSKNKEGFETRDAIVQTVFLLAFFIPFSYLMDVLMYRAYRRRTGDASKHPGKKR